MATRLCLQFGHSIALVTLTQRSEAFGVLDRLLQPLHLVVLLARFSVRLVFELHSVRPTSFSLEDDDMQEAHVSETLDGDWLRHNFMMISQSEMKRFSYTRQLSCTILSKN